MYRFVFSALFSLHTMHGLQLYLLAVLVFMMKLQEFPDFFSPLKEIHSQHSDRVRNIAMDFKGIILCCVS